MRRLNLGIETVNGTPTIRTVVRLVIVSALTPANQLAATAAKKVLTHSTTDVARYSAQRFHSMNSVACS